MALTTILTSTTAGSLFTASPPFSATVTQAQIRQITNPLVIQTELSLPEGTPIQMVIRNLSNAPTIAAKLNAQYQSGQLVDEPTGEKVLAWSGAHTIASASGTTLTLQWRKGQPFIVPIIWGIVIIIAIIGIYLLIRQLRQSPWVMSQEKVSQAATATGPLGVPWWEWVLGGAAILVAGPLAIRQADKLVRSQYQLRQDVHHDV